MKKKLAVSCYKKAISLEKDNARAHYNLGLLYIDDGKLSEATNKCRSCKADSTDVNTKKSIKPVIETI